MKQTLWVVTCAVLLLALPAYGQDRSADANMQILRDEIKVDKRAVVATNMDLSEAEARDFWPIYEHYQNDLRIINDRQASVVISYANAYNAGPVADETARRLLEESVALDDAELKLRREYAVRVSRVIPAAKAARYMQIEDKIRAAFRYELAANIPLVE